MTDFTNIGNIRSRANLINLACEVLAKTYPAVPQSLIQCQAESLQNDSLSEFLDANLKPDTFETVGKDEVSGDEMDDDDDNNDDDNNNDDDEFAGLTRDMANLRLFDSRTEFNLECDKRLLKDLEASQILSTGSSAPETDDGYVWLPPPAFESQEPELVDKDEVENLERSHRDIRDVLSFLQVQQNLRDRRARAKLAGEKETAGQS